MKKTKRLLTITMAMLMAGSMSMTSLAAGWQKNSAGWWWQNNDGSWPINGWQWLDGNNDGIAECYYFDTNGYMLENTNTPDGYMVDNNGAWIVSGLVQTRLDVNAVQIQNQDQNFQNGWFKENNSWKYYINSKAITGWKKIDGKTYYFDNDVLCLQILIILAIIFTILIVVAFCKRNLLAKMECIMK